MRLTIHSLKRWSFWLLFAGGSTAFDAHAADCSCTKMIVHYNRNTRFAVCSNFLHEDFVEKNECAREEANEENACEGFKYRFDCKIGVNSVDYDGTPPQQKTGVGIDASISGTPSECKSGLLLQMELEVDGQVRLNPPRQSIPKHTDGPIEIGEWKVNILPRGGKMPKLYAATDRRQDFGPDNYSDWQSNTVLIEEAHGHISWWDNTDQYKAQSDKNKKAEWTYRYFAYVKGSTPDQTCGCVYRIHVLWKDQKPTTTYSKDSASPPCTLMGGAG